MAEVTRLFEWQVPIADRIRSVLQEHNTALVATCTGSGKTYMSLDTGDKLGFRNIFVMAPKSVLSMWYKVSQEMGIPVLDVLNIERLKTGRTDYVEKLPKGFKWTLPDNTLLIVDEVHRCGAIKTQNAVLLAQAKAQGIPTLMLSATPFDSPLKMRAIGYHMGLHSWTVGSFYDFCRRNGCYNSSFHNGLEFPKGQRAKYHLERIQSRIADKLIKLSADEIPGFPSNQISPELIDLDDSVLDKANRVYEEFRKRIADEVPDNPLTEQLRARQEVEYLKIPVLEEHVLSVLDEGDSCVVFVGFRDTALELHRVLEAGGVNCSLVIGGQKSEDRDRAVSDFQNDRTRVCICTIQAGGESISLHHTETSRHPRQSIIIPNHSAVQLLQALGRIARAGSLSPARQRILLAAGTIEEEIYRNVKRKLANIETLTDNDLAVL